MTSIAPNQIAAIQTLRRKAGMAEEDYRDWLRHDFLVKSTKDLTRTQAVRAIATLRKFTSDAAPRSSAHRASGPYAPVLQALWIAAWNLGLARSRDDKALLAFVQRQTGMSHTRFLTDRVDALKAIEGLKAWLARDGGVRWPAGRSDTRGRKLAILHAQNDRLKSLSLPVETIWPDTSDEEVDRISARLGAKIRAAIGQA